MALLESGGEKGESDCLNHCCYLGIEFNYY